MFKILIAEDKRLTREGMVRLTDWDSAGAKVVFDCGNGASAIGYLKSHPVDIVITDIRMDPVDGLALAAFVKEHFPKIKVLMVSAYQEFEYAHQALEMGVAGYLLKPVDEKQLLSKVLEIIGQLQREETVAQQLHEFSRQRTRDILMEYVTDLYPLPDLLEKRLLERHENPHDLQAVLFCIQAPGRDRSLAEIREYFRSRHEQCISFIWEGKMIIGLLFTPLETFHRAAVQYASLLRSTGTPSMRMVVSETLQDVAELPATFQMVQKLWDYAYLHDFGRITCQDELHQPLPEIGLPASFLLEEVVQYARKNEAVLLQASLDRSFDQFFKTNSSVDSILKECGELARCLDHALHTSEEDSLQRLFSPWSLGSLSGFSSLREYVCNTVCEAALLHAGQQNAIRPIVRSAMNYAKAHFSDADLTLKEVSRQLGVSYVYLSKAFKEDCGISYTNYVNSCRLDEAKQILLKEGTKIPDICCRIGLEEKNFYYLFKKRECMTPQEYRRIFFENREEEPCTFQSAGKHI